LTSTLPTMSNIFGFGSSAPSSPPQMTPRATPNTYSFGVSPPPRTTELNMFGFEASSPPRTDHGSCFETDLTPCFAPVMCFETGPTPCFAPSPPPCTDPFSFGGSPPPHTTKRNMFGFGASPAPATKPNTFSFGVSRPSSPLQKAPSTGFTLGGNAFESPRSPFSFTHNPLASPRSPSTAGVPGSFGAGSTGSLTRPSTPVNQSVQDHNKTVVSDVRVAKKDSLE
jgi:hypothetical protein